MVSAFVAGSLLAFGHHLFYAGLEQQPVPTGSYNFSGRQVSKQQFNAAVGIAFAFLVKNFLCTAVAIGYTQIFWTNTVNAKRSPSLAELDWAHALILDIYGLFSLKQGWRHPVLVFMALIFW